MVDIVYLLSYYGAFMALFGIGYQLWKAVMFHG